MAVLYSPQQQLGAAACSFWCRILLSKTEVVQSLNYRHLFKNFIVRYIFGDSMVALSLAFS